MEYQLIIGKKTTRCTVSTNTRMNVHTKKLNATTQKLNVQFSIKSCKSILSIINCEVLLLINNFIPK